MSDQADFERWSRLTNKQRACLDPLLERKTSKEIARMVGVSKPTVDQRLTTARSVLGVDTRDQAAIEYARLKQKYDRITYDPMHIPSPSKLVPSNFPDGDPADVQLTDCDSHEAEGSVGGFTSLFGELWRHDHPTARRATIMMSILVGLLFVLLAGLGIAQALSRLVSD